MADAFNSEIKQVGPGGAPSYGPSLSEPKITKDTSIGDAAKGVSDIFKIGFGALKDEQDNQSDRAVESAIDNAYNDSLGTSNVDPLSTTLDKLSRMKEASTQGGDTSTKFNLSLAAAGKEWAVNNPHRVADFQKGLRDRGLVDPRIALVNAQAKKEAEVDAARTQTTDAIVDKYVKAGLAVYSTPGDPTSPVDVGATLKVHQAKMDSDHNTAQWMARMGIAKKEDGTTTTYTRPEYLAGMPKRMQDVQNEVFTNLRPYINDLSTALNQPGPTNVKDIQARLSNITQLASGFTQRQQAYAADMGFNSAETADYLKQTSDMMNGLTKGVVDISNTSDINQMKSLSLAIDMAGRRADMLTVENAPFIFQIGRLSPSVLQGLTAGGLFANQNLEGGSRSVAKDLTSIRNLFSETSNPPPGSAHISGTEDDFSKKEKTERLNFSVQSLQTYNNKNIVNSSPEDTYAWIKFHAPLYNASQAGNLSRTSKDNLTHLFSQNNWLANYQVAKSKNAPDAAKVGQFAFTTAYGSVLDGMRELSGMGGAEGKFQIQFDPSAGKFVATNNPGAEGSIRNRGTIGTRNTDEQGNPLMVPFRTPVAPEQQKRLDKLNASVPLLLGTRDTVDAFKQGSDTDFLNGIVKFSQDMGLQGGTRNGDSPLAGPNEFNTSLNADEETKFQDYIKANNKSGDLEDYDLRGAFKAGITADPRGHLPDTYKKPNHPTFSNESQYSGTSGLTGGEWIDKGEGHWEFKATPDNLKFHSKEELQRYFKEREPESVITFPDEKTSFLGKEMNDIVKKFENDGKVGRNSSGQWSSVASLEGGTDTIGYGHKLTDEEAKGKYVNLNGFKVPLDKGLSDPQVEQLLAQDMRTANSFVDSEFPNLPSNQKEAVASLVFNVGATKFKSSQAYKNLKDGKVDQFVQEAFDEDKGFTRINGDVSKGLINRRAKERDMFLAGAEGNDTLAGGSDSDTLKDPLATPPPEKPSMATLIMGTADVSDKMEKEPITHLGADPKVVTMLPDTEGMGTRGTNEVAYGYTYDKLPAFIKTFLERDDVKKSGPGAKQTEDGIVVAAGQKDNLTIGTLLHELRHRGIGLIESGSSALKEIITPKMTSYEMAVDGKNIKEEDYVRLLDYVTNMDDKDITEKVENYFKGRSMDVKKLLTNEKVLNQLMKIQSLAAKELEKKGIKTPIHFPKDM